MFTKLLNKTAAIERRTSTQQANGELSDAWNTVSGLSSVPCRYTPKSSTVLDGIGRTYKITTSGYTFFFEAGVPVMLEDRISVDGKLFQVDLVNTYDGQASAHHMQVGASLVETQ